MMMTVMVVVIMVAMKDEVQLFTGSYSNNKIQEMRSTFIKWSNLGKKLIIPKMGSLQYPSLHKVVFSLLCTLYLNLTIII